MAKAVTKSGPYIFRSYDHWPQNPEVPNILENNPGHGHAIPIVHVARATSAAPSYFDSVIIQDRKFGDGGFGTNNPSEQLLNEVYQMSNGDVEAVKVFVSLGTGFTEIIRFSDRILEPLTWLNAAKKLATDAQEKHKTMLGRAADNGVPYFRFNVGMQHTRARRPGTSKDTNSEKSVEDGRPSGSTTQSQQSASPPKTNKKPKKTLGDMKLDEWKKEGGFFRRAHEDTTLEQIKAFTATYLESEEVIAELEEVAQKLVFIRRQRSQSPLWTMVSTGLQYRCPEKACVKGMKLRDCEENLRLHLMRKHGMGDDTVEREEKLRERLAAGELPY
jgi:hypothetical protein